MSRSSAWFRVVLVALVVIGAALARDLVFRVDPLIGIRRAWNDLPSRPVEGRLVGLAYGPRPVDDGPTRAEVVRLRAAATKFIERPYRGADPQRERGVAALLGDRSGEAVQELENCTRVDPGNDRCWSDLAVAYIQIARHHDDARAAANALAAADRALQIAPGRPEALFNRAVALESLSLNRPAIVAWRRYLAADGESPWTVEARERMRDLDTATARQLWDQSLPRLERAVQNADQGTIEPLVRAFPQEARTWGERRFLCEWGEAIRQGDTDRAAQRLALARETSAALQIVNGEQLLADAVSAIDRAPDHWIAPLTEAYEAYGQARDLYAARNPTAARPLFEKSAIAFRRVRSPMFRVAEYYVASCLADLGENERSYESATRQFNDAPTSYVALRAQLLWQKAIAASRMGLVFESMDGYTHAFEIFQQQDEKLNAGYLRAALCLLNGMMGHDAEAWRLRREDFRDVSRLGDPRGLQTSLIATAGAEAINGRWDLAYSFYNLSIERELEPPNPVQLAEATVWRTLAAHRLGWEGVAARGILRARTAVTNIPDEKMRASSTNRLHLAEGVILRDADPDQAMKQFTAAIDEVIDLFSLPEAYLERGRAWRKLRRDDEAIADFRKALDLVDRREQSASVDRLRDSYFAAPDAAAEELMDLLDERGLQQEALAVAERSRARLFAPLPDPPPIDPQRVPRGTLLVHYTALPGRLVIFMVSDQGIGVVRVPAPRAMLLERIAAFTTAIHRGEDLSIHALGRELYDLLIAPLGVSLKNVSRLVIVPDTTVAAVPFAALRTPSRMFLAESLQIVHAPSAAVFLQTLRQPRSPEKQGLLAVGNPDFDRKMFPHFEPLPAAEAEARDVARRDDSAVLLTGAAATPSVVIEQMQASRVINIAAHAVLDRRDPSHSALLLAASPGDPGVLYLSRIADLSIRAEVVVLAGCRTAAVLEETPPSLRSFAFAFIGAGSRNVVASLWNADDEAARAMSRLFHQHLRAGATPALALRETQLTMLRSSDPRLRAPLAWSGYQLYGSGS